MKENRTIGDDILDLVGFKVDEFRPKCKRCNKPIMWGQSMGESVGVGGTYWFHEYPADCGIVKDWANAGGIKPNE